MRAAKSGDVEVMKLLLKLNEEGTTTTPFDMTVLNDLDRFHLVIDVIDRVPCLGSHAAELRQRMVDERLRCRAYTRTEGDDPPEISNWTWTHS